MTRNPMFHGEPWFAWWPVQCSGSRGPRWVWLVTVWRETTSFSDGTTTVRFYSH